MKFGSVCSGIEAASVAWHPLGWRASFFSEIDPFCKSLLKHHYPDVPNLGDLEGLYTRGPLIRYIQEQEIDVLVGGTPCQAFSVAGRRLGLSDPRGNLTLSFLKLIAALKQHGRAGRPPRWIVWENVPGVLSIDGGRTFRTFIRLLGELGYGVGWRVLDAQHFGVPQRRRRVFVVGYFGDWRRAAAVLFDEASVRGNIAKGGKAGEAVAALTSNGVGTCGADDNQGQAGHLIASTFAFGGNNTTGPIDVETACNAHGGGGRMDFESETFITHRLRADGFDASEDGTGRGTTLVPIVFSCKDHAADAGYLAPTLRAMPHDRTHANAGGKIAIAFNLRGRDGGSQPELDADSLASVRASNGGSSRSYIAQYGVRRLTPRECERLQGFPDDYTLIRHRGKLAADGPRYKSIGNSMAVPVMRHIGRRIQLIDRLTGGLPA